MNKQRGAMLLSAVLAIMPPTVAAQGQLLQGDALVKALQKGGYVIAMRHAASPREAPSKEAANADNTAIERQLDENGRSTAIAFGKALRDLKIPIGDVLVSPRYRAQETVRLAQLPKPQTHMELEILDSGPNMQQATPAQGAWLKQKAAEFSSGKNTIIITHLPNLSAAFPDLAKGMEDGDAMILGPDGKGGATLVARVKIEEWPRLKP